MSEDKLAVLTAIDRQLARVVTVDEAKEIRDKAEAIRVYAKSARLGLGIQNEAARVKIRAEQRAGEMLKLIQRTQGRRGATGLRSIMERSQIPPVMGHRWQAMTVVPEKRILALAAEWTEKGKPLTSSAVFKIARGPKPPPQPIETPGFATGPFQTLVIDPPWPIAKVVLDRRPVEREQMDYPTLDLEKIRALPIERLANPDGCHVYLWVTHRFLPVGLECFEKWGVRYECVLTWIKPTAQPLWWKFNTEHVLFGKVGSLAPLIKGQAVGFTAPQQRHSHKPEAFYQLVRTVSPEPRYTLFDEEREGFTAWGVVHQRAEDV